MEFWIYLNNEKRGPYSVEQLQNMTIPPTTLVWREGMGSWLAAVEIPELTQLYSHHSTPPPPPEPPQVQETENNEMEQEDIETNNEVITPPDFNPGNFIEEQAQEPSKECGKPQAKCPPTYLVWAILTTLCCCQLFGIIAIVYAANVKSKYDRGDFEGAAKYSERAALWVILAFVIGLATMPLQSLLSALTSM